MSDYGSAFPCEQHETQDGTWNQSFDPGMSLRDYFAAKAMQAIIAKLPIGDACGVLGNPPPQGETRGSIMQNVVLSAYDYADEMLKARQQ